MSKDDQNRQELVTALTDFARGAINSDGSNPNQKADSRRFLVDKLKILYRNTAPVFNDAQMARHVAHIENHIKEQIPDKPKQNLWNKFVSFVKDKIAGYNPQDHNLAAKEDFVSAIDNALKERKQRGQQTSELYTNGQRTIKANQSKGLKPIEEKDLTAVAVIMKPVPTEVTAEFTVQCNKRERKSSQSTTLEL